VVICVDRLRSTTSEHAAAATLLPRSLHLFLTHCVLILRVLSDRLGAPGHRRHDAKLSEGAPIELATLAHLFKLFHNGLLLPVCLAPNRSAGGKEPFLLTHECLCLHVIVLYLLKD